MLRVTSIPDNGSTDDLYHAAYQLHFLAWLESESADTAAVKAPNSIHSAFFTSINLAERFQGNVAIQ